VTVVIVGAGVLGAALAQTFARLGHDVTLVEQYELGDPRAASSARSRILRIAHGADVADTRSAWRSRELWRELECGTGTRLFTETGMAWFAPAGDSHWERESVRVLGDEGIPVELLAPRDALRLFPRLRVDDLDHVLLEPHGGLLHAREATHALVQDALTSGARLLRGQATPDEERVSIDGRYIEADRVVWACGAWTPRLFPALVSGTVIQQDVFYVEASGGWSSPPVPAWGEARRAVTGAGSLVGSGFKVGIDAPGPPFDLDGGARTPVAGHEAHARAYLRGRFPDIADARLVHTETCQTVALETGLTEPTALLGGEVRLVQHPEHSDVWLLGDGSGHAFKHAPAIAEEVARLLG